jgi:hypothetical protein
MSKLDVWYGSYCPFFSAITDLHDHYSKRPVFPGNGMIGARIGGYSLVLDIMLNSRPEKVMAR